MNSCKYGEFLNQHYKAPRRLNYERISRISETVTFIYHNSECSDNSTEHAYHERVRQYILRVMHRQGFSFRRPTHTAQNAEVDVEVVANFVQMVNAFKTIYGIADNCVVNMDQTNVPFDEVHTRTIVPIGI